jgi:membrane protein required for colicin V production
MSGLGLMDKILGFVFGSGKFFFIASVIVYAVYNFKAVRENIDFEGSFMFPALVETGRVIMHIDGEKIADDINESIDKGLEGTKEIMKDEVAQDLLNSANEEKDALIKTVNKKFKESNLSLPTEAK